MKINIFVLFILSLSISFSSGVYAAGDYGIDTSTRSGRCALMVEKVVNSYYKAHEKVLNALDRSKFQDKDSENKNPVALQAPPENAEKLPQKILDEQERLRIYYKFKESITENLEKAVKKYDALVKAVIDPQEGFLTKIMMSRKAKYTVYVGTYIFKADNVGYPLLKEAKEALKRGVNVRIVIDSGGSPSVFHGELKSLLEYAAKNAGYRLDPATGQVTDQKATVETVLFNPTNVGTKIMRNFVRRAFNLTAPKDSRVDIVQSWLNRRNHSKIFAIDLEDPDLAIMMTGGRNLDESYYAIPQYDDKTYNDVEVLVRNKPGSPKDGNVSDEMADFYNKIFYHMGNKWLSRSITGVLFGMYDTHLNNMDTVHAKVLGGEKIAAKLQGMIDGNYLTDGFEDAEFSLLNTVDNVLRHHVAEENGGMGNSANAKLVNQSHILRQFEQKIQTAKNKITIVTPYPDFTPELIKLLQDWLAADPTRTLTVFTNSIMTSDNMPAQINVDQTVGRLFGNTAQTKVYEYGQLDAIQLGGKVPYPKVHAKFFIFDDQDLMVGTFNLDWRSDYLNVEDMGHATPTDPNSAFVQAYVQIASTWIGQSYLVGSPEWNQLRAAHALAAPKRLVVSDETILKAIQRIFNIEWLF